MPMSLCFWYFSPSCQFSRPVPRWSLPLLFSGQDLEASWRSLRRTVTPPLSTAPLLRPTTRISSRLCRQPWQTPTRKMRLFHRMWAKIFSAVPSTSALRICKNPVPRPGMWRWMLCPKKRQWKIFCSRLTLRCKTTASAAQPDKVPLFIRPHFRSWLPIFWPARQCFFATMWQWCQVMPKNSWHWRISGSFSTTIRQWKELFMAIWSLCPTCQLWEISGL